MDSALAATSEQGRQGFYDQAERLLAEVCLSRQFITTCELAASATKCWWVAKNNVEGRIYSKDLYPKNR